jgi:hypothetical protein
MVYARDRALALMVARGHTLEVRASSGAAAAQLARPRQPRVATVSVGAAPPLDPPPSDALESQSSGQPW